MTAGAVSEQTGFASALGAVVREIGEPCFHLKLFELVGSVLPHEMGWIVRYSAASEPDILYTKAISATVVDYYLEAKPSSGDPYLRSWRANAAPRVETLDAALPSAPDRDVYSSRFMQQLEFADELGLYLPSSDNSCLSLFFERRSQRFTREDIRHVEQLFPLILDCHLAHMRSLFRGMSNLAAGRPSIEASAAAIFDRNGAQMFATEKWRDLEAASPALRGLADAASAREVEALLEASALPFTGAPLEPMHPIAPGGLLVHLVDGAELAAFGAEREAALVLHRLTPRERDVMALTLEGLSTGAIAQRLGIAKGSIKNVRLRIYRKLGVTSERELVSMTAPFSTPLKASLAR